MLMLSVKEEDYVMINDNIKIRVVRAGSVFKLGIEAPRDVRITRSDVFEKQSGAVDGSYEKSKRRYNPSATESAR